MSIVTYPKIVLVGRMNVGKSAVFNRLSHRERSIVFEKEGVTRDYVHELVTWDGKTFDLIDAGGISFDRGGDELASLINEQIQQLIEDAAVVLFVCDIRSGVTREDQDIARRLHRLSKNVIVVLNKTDNDQIFQEYHADFFALGFDTMLPVSATHGRGIGSLLDEIVVRIPKKKKIDGAPDYKMVLLGKPNVGKSSLMNLLLRHKRSLVSSKPGTTREAITERLAFYRESIQITDTAGIRRKKKVDEPLEELMVKSSFASVRRSDLVILMVDVSAGMLSDQERKLLFYAHEQKKCIVLVFNKNDLLTDELQYRWKLDLSQYDFILNKIPQIWISCIEGMGGAKVLKEIQKVRARAQQEFFQEDLEVRVLEKFNTHPMYRAGGKRIKLHGIRQIKGLVPTFIVYINSRELFDDAAFRFIENSLRSSYDLKGCPVKFMVREI